MWRAGGVGEKRVRGRVVLDASLCGFRMKWGFRFVTGVEGGAFCGESNVER